MFHENTELVNEISCFYDSPYFVHLNKNDQDILRIKFESLIQIRDITIEGLIDILSRKELLQECRRVIGWFGVEQ